MKLSSYLKEDTLKVYDAWGKKIILGIDNDNAGGFIKVSIDDKIVGKIYIITKEELERKKV